MKAKATPDLYFFVFIALSFLFHYLCPVLTVISFSWVGIAFIIIGAVIVALTNSILLKKRTSVNPFDSPSSLITSGPFRWSRNPIYLGMTLALLGIAILLGSLSPFIFPLVFTIIIDRSFIQNEESKLEKLFGKEYLAYKKRVNRWYGRRKITGI
ncbi:methyltransferase family protein [Parapedobacter lycopersici]|uniref:methyltransferase family protein n=1 Tax=Parapedobacter lycopersici TaxID=1864939 RepID=UPI00214D2624|nr:isoprenylcysteine carboxylmethyltransferase family protein [Parapedobacter lycopersici]